MAAYGAMASVSRLNGTTISPLTSQFLPSPATDRSVVQKISVRKTPLTSCHGDFKSWKQYIPEREQHNPFQRFAKSFLNTLEEGLAKLYEGFEGPLPSTVDPQVQLEGNFAPVEESPVQLNLEVTGTLPQSLQGVFVRNGPNPQFFPTGRHHLFDGDGMLHAVTFKEHTASYACRYTRTYRLAEEKKAGKSFFPKPIGELHGYGGVLRMLLFWTRSLFGLVDASQGMGVANAGLAFFEGRLLAISEDDLPVEVRITKEGDIETIGRYDFHGQLKTSMIAHPKLDPYSSELFTLSYNVLTAPFLTYFVFSPECHKKIEVEISLPEGTMIHDFAITENYVVIPDQQIVFRLRQMLTGGSPVVLDTKKIPRFGVMPRYDLNEIRLCWIDVPDCFVFHICNAWEEDYEVVVIASCMTPPDIIFKTSDAPKSILCEIRLNPKTRTSKRRELASLNLEVGKVNPNYVGYKTQFVYLAIAEPWPKVSGIAKVDLVAGKVVATYMYEPQCHGGEAVFVPNTCYKDAPEDDGLLLVFMHNEVTGKSELLVLDAASTSLTQIASVKLPSRVPYGFHGAFISANEWAEQL